MNTSTVFYGFAGPIDSGSVTRIAAAFNTAVNNGAGEIHITFNSPGGSIHDGVYLYNHIRSLPVPVIMHNTGHVGSIATIVFLAADTRLCSAHASFMIHSSFIQPFQQMPAAVLQDQLTATLAADQRIEGILRDRCILPKDFWNAWQFRDVHMAPQKALTFGIVHHVKEASIPHGHHVFQI